MSQTMHQVSDYSNTCLAYRGETTANKMLGGHEFFEREDLNPPSLEMLLTDKV
jgi:hypothetical protein